MRAVDRHPNRVRTEHDQQIMRSKYLGSLLLIARQRSHKARVVRKEMGAIGDGLLIDRAAKSRCEQGGFVESITLHDLVADHDDRAVRR